MRRGVFFVVFLVLLFVLAFGLARFLEENSNPVQLRFLIWRTKEAALGNLISLSFLGGVLLSSVVLLGSVFSKTLEAKRLRRENLALQKMMEIKEPKLQANSSHHSSSSK